MRWGIGTKLTLVFALLGLGGAGLTGFYSYQASRHLQQESARGELLNATQVLGRRITQHLDAVQRNLQLLSQWPATTAVLDADMPQGASVESLQMLFKGMLQANPSYLHLSLLAAQDGRELVCVDRMDGLPVRRDIPLLPRASKVTAVLPVFFSDALRLPEGGLYLSPVSSHPDVGLMADAEAGGDVPTLSAAMPVYGGMLGKPVGLIVVRLDLNSLFRLLAADLPDDYRLYLSSGRGEVLFSSPAEAQDRGSLLNTAAAPASGLRSRLAKNLQSEFGAVQALVEHQREQVVMQTQGGEGREALVAAFVAQSVASLANGNQLILGLAEPLDRVLAESRPMGAATLRIVLGVGIGGMLLAIVLARALSRPINDMADSARRFALGQGMGELPLTRSDEIGSLAHSLQLLQQQIGQQMSDLHRKQVELAHLSQHDSLTELPNRRLFLERLDRTLRHARRHLQTVHLLFIDLNEFKAINDRCGHAVGDEVLRLLARRLAQTVRALDTVARLGGDEFVVLLGDAVSEADVGLIADKLLHTVCEPMVCHGLQLQVGGSIGVACYPRDGQTAQELLAHADRAMYAAKAQGGGVHLAPHYERYPPAFTGTDHG